MTMNNSEALKDLRDIHLPDPVPFWPPAPGWWLLALVVVLLLIAAGWLWKRHRRTAYRRAALRELQQLRQALTQGQARTSIIAELSILLRRAAISRYGRQQVAALNGTAWLDFLDRTGRTTHFSTQGQALLDAPYRRDTLEQIEPLLSLAQRWLQVQR
jgi:Domain of unknown function (DUF4381)